MLNMSVDHKQKGINQLDDRLIDGLSNGIDKSADYLKNKMVQKVESNIQPALKTETIERKGSSVALFDTGEMYSQIDADIQRMSAKVGVIGSKAEIATHHEFGAPAAGIPERSFIRSTFNEEKGKMEKIVAGEIKKEI
jgi:phage gpG-like protein